MKHKTRKFEMGGPTSYAESGSAGGGAEMSFSKAFKAARAVAKREGRDPDKEEFTWKGGKYKANLEAPKKSDEPTKVKNTETTTEVETPSSARPRSSGRGRGAPGTREIDKQYAKNRRASYGERINPFSGLNLSDLFGLRKEERVMRDMGVSREEARKRLDALEDLKEREGMRHGGAVKKMNKGGMPDLTGDGKVTRADVLKGRGVFRHGGSVNKYAGGGSVSSASKRADGIAKKGKTRGRII